MVKLIDVACHICSKIVQRVDKHHKYEMKKAGGYKPIVCSKECKRKLLSKSREVACANCSIVFLKLEKNINKTNNNFCSRQCANTFQHENKAKPLEKDAQCFDCNRAITVNGHVSINWAFCSDCKIKRELLYNKGNPITDHSCIICNNIFTGFSLTKYCDDCRFIAYKKAGIASAQSQALSRRSKNEIYFYNLCFDYFNNVEANAPIFISKYGNWDADVIIHDYKIAVLWNGIWHYQKITEKHSVAQVQARDKIKIDVIRSNGFIPYIIKDMGKEDVSFVINEFSKFLELLFLNKII